MERAKLIFKPLAIVSAILLVGAFVGYRAGAYHRPTPPEPQPEPQPAATATQPVPEGQPVPYVDHKTLALMAGSKSAAVFTPGQQFEVPWIIVTPNQADATAPPMIPPAQP